MKAVAVVVVVVAVVAVVVGVAMLSVIDPDASPAAISIGHEFRTWGLPSLARKPLEKAEILANQLANLKTGRCLILHQRMVSWMQKQE